MSRYSDDFSFRQPLRVRALGSLFCVLILFYLAFHTVSGERGVFAFLRENGKLETMKAELMEIKTKRENLQRKIDMLGGKAIDIDLLDERARLILGTVGKDEVVILVDTGK